MSAPQVLLSDKALPSIARGKLPPTPALEDPAALSSSPPQLPPKFTTYHEPSPRLNGLPPPPIDVAASNELLGQGGAHILLPCVTSQAPCPL